MSFEDGQRLISAFVNSLAWVRRTGINTAQFGGGSQVYGLGGPDAKALFDDHFELDYVPDAANDQARLALAFYREGMTLNSAAYQCLSFFKVLNITLTNSIAQKKWIDANIAAARQLEPHATRGWEAKAGFDPALKTPGDYLYVSNRCAIAHAASDPLIDPDDPDDRRRLANDLPMVKALAEHFIEKEFGIKSAMTVWREHLYELHGFAVHFGYELVARIKSGEKVPLDQIPPVPPLSIRLANRAEFVTLNNFSGTVVGCADGCLNIELSSTSGVTSVFLALNFASERLDFEIFHHLATEDDGSIAGAEAILDTLRFTDFYIRNGKLEIWVGSSRWSRKDAFIPENIDMNATFQNYKAMISKAEQVLEQRRG